MGSRHKVLLYPGNVGGSHCPRYAREIGAECDRGRRDGFPTAGITRGDMIVAFPPRKVGAGLASGMADLNAGYRSRSLDRLDHRCKRLGLRLVPQTGAAGSDAPFRGDRSCLDDNQARTAACEGGEMDVMPVIGQAVLGRILAHGRDSDAILERNPFQGERLEQGSHDGFFLDEERWSMMDEAVFFLDSALERKLLLIRAAQ